MNTITLFDTPIDNQSRRDGHHHDPDTLRIGLPAANAIAAGAAPLGARREDQPEQLLVDVRAAAQMLSISRALVYELMAAGELPSVVIHRCRRIAVEELRGYVERLGADR